MNFKSQPYWLKGIILGVLTAVVLSLPVDIIFSLMSFQSPNIMAVLFNLLWGIIIGCVIGAIYGTFKKNRKAKTRKKAGINFLTFTSKKFMVFLFLIFFTYMLQIFSWGCIFAGEGICTPLIGFIGVLTIPQWIFKGYDIYSTISYYTLQIFWWYILACVTIYLYGKYVAYFKKD